MQSAGYRIGGLFFGLGSTVFSNLWFRSCYIPRGLAVWGIFSSLVPVIITLAIIVSPTFEARLWTFSEGSRRSTDTYLRSRSGRLAAR
jgi:hypothetical protein